MLRTILLCALTDLQASLLHAFNKYLLGEIKIVFDYINNILHSLAVQLDWCE